jgi:hypothetical protein
MDQCAQAAAAFAKGVEAIDGLELTGRPAMTVVGLKAAKPRKLNIYAVNDMLARRGWHLNALQLPPALHMCFTAQHVDVVDALLKVLHPPCITICITTLCCPHPTTLLVQVVVLCISLRALVCELLTAAQTDAPAVAWFTAARVQGGSLPQDHVASQCVCRRICASAWRRCRAAERK